MPPLIWPPNPDFKSGGERELFEVLQKVLTEKDALLANVRFTDPVEGDVEVDLIALIDGLGAIFFEHKGGCIDCCPYNVALLCDEPLLTSAMSALGSNI